MRIAVFPNVERDKTYKHTRRLIQRITAEGARAVVRDSDRDGVAGLIVDYDSSFQSADLLICLGGDGTFLSSLHLGNGAFLPTIGVNLGSVGFLPEILPDALEEAVRALVAREYRIEPRMMIDCLMQDQAGSTLSRHRALNDVVLSRGPGGRIVTVILEINGEPVEQVPGDGVIVSTPTGSTAYALSAGGPIVHPALWLMLITPICPHSLHNRSYITGESSQVRLTLGDYPEAGSVQVDGQISFPLAVGESLLVRPAAKAFQLVRLASDVFYQTLPAKIQQRGMMR